jgi:hypothetical protein
MARLSLLLWLSEEAQRSRSTSPHRLAWDTLNKCSGLRVDLLYADVGASRRSHYVLSLERVDACYTLLGMQPLELRPRGPGHVRMLADMLNEESEDPLGRIALQMSVYEDARLHKYIELAGMCP